MTRSQMRTENRKRADLAVDEILGRNLWPGLQYAYQTAEKTDACEIETANQKRNQTGIKGS